MLTKGTKKVSDIEISDNISADFDEVRIDFFSRSEYLEFTKRYIECFYKYKNKQQFTDRRIEEIDRLNIDDLIKWPVQARMLAQVLLNPNNSLEKLSRYDLYNLFIEDCLSREDEKPQRKKTDRQVRRRFMQDLAWWLWAIRRTRTFTAQDIPKSLAKDYVSEDQDQVGQIRELLVGSVVEERSIGSLVNEKAAGTFYFPHLSFTEFLVTEYLIERQLKESDITLLAQLLEGEIQSFIQGYKNQDGRLKLYNDLTKHQGALPWTYIKFLSGSSNLVREGPKLIRNDVRQIWQFAVAVVVLLETEHAEKALTRCAEIIGSDNYVSTAIAVQLILKALLTRDVLRQFAANLFLKAVFRAIHIDKLADMVRRPFSEYRITSDTEDLCVSLLSEVRGISDGFEFDGAAAYKAALHQKLAIVDDSDHEPVMMRVKYSEVRRALRTKHDQDRFEAWFRALKAGPVFSGGRDRWQPARSRVGYSELTGNRS